MQKQIDKLRSLSLSVVIALKNNDKDKMHEILAELVDIHVTISDDQMSHIDYVRFCGMRESIENIINFGLTTQRGDALYKYLKENPQLLHIMHIFGKYAREIFLGYYKNFENKNEKISNKLIAIDFNKTLDIIKEINLSVNQFDQICEYGILNFITSPPSVFITPEGMHLLECIYPGWQASEIKEHDYSKLIKDY